MAQRIPISQRSILVVDDEALIRMDLADFFQDQGYKVYEADDADHAISILENVADIHVVLTDVQMPGSMDGVKLAHFIRDRWPPTLLVVSSGAVDVPNAELPLDAMFFAKPFDRRFVLGEIERRMN